MRAADAVRALRALADPERARFAQHFFRTGPGQYGEGDRFLGLRVPQVRKIARDFRSLPLREIEKLRSYLAHTDRINSWDLVDVSAPHIVGAHLQSRSRSVLARLARSKSLNEAKKVE